MLNVDLAETKAGKELIQLGVKQGIEKGIEKGKQEGELEGRVAEACEALLDFLEIQFGLPSPRLLEKLLKIRNYEFLRLLRRQFKHCQDATELEGLIDQAAA